MFISIGALKLCFFKCNHIAVFASSRRQIGLADKERCTWIHFCQLLRTGQRVMFFMNVRNHCTRMVVFDSWLEFSKPSFQAAPRKQLIEERFALSRGLKDDKECQVFRHFYMLFSHTHRQVARLQDVTPLNRTNGGVLATSILFFMPI